jgi:hypothetical protein
MKNLPLLLIAVILLSSSPITASAAVYGDFSFSMQTAGGVLTATITNYDGTDAFVTIPSFVISGNNEYTVNKIGGNMNGFYQNGLIEKVIIPETVTEIGVSAFIDCVNLKYVEIAGNVNVSKMAFKGCINLREVIFLSDVNSIRNKAFMNCDKLSVIYFKGSLPLLCEFGSEELLSNHYERVFCRDEMASTLLIQNLTIYADSYNYLDFYNLGENSPYDTFDEHTWKSMPIKINSDISPGFDANGDIALTVGNVENVAGKTLICAVYQDGKMLGVGLDTITASDEYVFTGLSGSIENALPGDYCIKSFIWNDLGAIEPSSLGNTSCFEKTETVASVMLFDFFGFSDFSGFSGFSVTENGDETPEPEPEPDPISVYIDDDRTYTVYSLAE